MIKRFIILVFLLAIVAAASIQYWLPPAISAQLVQAISRKVDSDNVKVDIEQVSISQLFGIKIKKVILTAQNAKLDKLIVSDFQAKLQEVEFDIATVLTGRVEPKNIGDAVIKLSITQEELSRYVNESVKGIKNAIVTIKPENIRIKCNLSVGGLLNLEVALDGKVVVADKQKISFVTERFSLNNTSVGNIGGSVLTQISLADIEELPFGVKLREVKLEQGKLVVEADNHSN